MPTVRTASVFRVPVPAGLDPRPCAHACSCLAEELVESFKIFLESCEESDDSEPASRISGEMIVAVFKKVGIFDAGVTADDPRVQAMLSAAAKDDSGRWRPGMAEDGPQTIPFPAFRQMLYAFGDPMSSSFGISVRKSEVE